MHIAGYLCSPTHKDDVEYRPLRPRSLSDENNAQSHAVDAASRSRTQVWRLCTKWVKPWVAAGFGALLILASFFLFTFVVERYAIYNFEASGFALADPVEHYGDAADSAKRWVEDLSPRVSPVMVHSHNDYLRPRPLFSALSVGCASVEADIWLSSNGRDLLVGHHWWNLRPEKTLQSLYITPLLQILDTLNSPHHVDNHTSTDSAAGVFVTEPNKTLILFIDVKDDPAKTWPILLKHLEPLRARGYLSYHQKLSSTSTDQSFHSGPLTVVGTGNIVKRRDVNIGADLGEYQKYHDVFLDASLDLLSHPGFCQRIDSQCELQENEFYTASVSIWRALGIVIPYFSQAQRTRLKNQIKLAKDLNLKSRYWELPGWPTSQRNYVWRTLAHEGVDLLNADDIVSAATKRWHSDYTIEGAWILGIVSCLSSFVFTVMWFGRRMMRRVTPV
ncbi:Altered inheritance of mitochondria protein 6 [Fusarium poae]|uniref:Altered inheritance of mitochondria protein 6 n=1 Tax=Fusarium poae TaxID=36050 RepID=A0A1B8AWX8_FUSPO|nr:hypothetical protein FPOA_05403 [Fusarium poae]